MEQKIAELEKRIVELETKVAVSPTNDVKKIAAELQEYLTRSMRFESR